MKKRSLFFMGLVGSIAFYSCQKNIKEDAIAASDEAVSADHYNPYHHQPASLTNGTFAEVAYDHDAVGTFTEGPAVDKKGNVFFTDQNNDKIYKWDAKTGNVTLWLTGTGRSNGMAFDRYGNLIACADMHGELWKIFPNGHHQVLVNNYNGKLLNGPNDVWINPANGGIYITDPIFPRGYWDAGDPRIQGWPPTHSEQAATGKGGHVYYLAPGSHHLVRVTTMSDWDADIWPNGVVGTPDGKKLYVNEWTGGPTGTIWSFDIRPDGRLAHMKVFADGLVGCDGMSMDEYGNVYVSSGGVKAFNPKGELILTIATPGGAANNVFAGQNEKTLFITGGGSGKIFTQQMNVKGVEKFDGNGWGPHWPGNGHGHGHHW